MTESRTHHSVVVALAANAAIAAAKFAVAVITGSSSILSEAIHSAVDTGDEALLWVGLRKSRRPADETHPFGHGKDLYFWTTVVAVLVFAVGGGMSVYEGVVHLAHPIRPQKLAWSYAVLGIAAVFEGVSWTVAAREFARFKGSRSAWEAIHATKDPLVFTVLLEDSAALLGIAVAFGGVVASHVTGRAWIDAVGSIVIGLLLMSVAVILARESRGLLIGEAADPRIVAEVKRIAANDVSVDAVGRALTVHFGPATIVLNLELRFRVGLSASNVVEAVARIEATLRHAVPELAYIFIEASALRGHAR